MRITASDPGPDERGSGPDRRAQPDQRSGRVRSDRPDREPDLQGSGRPTRRRRSGLSAGDPGLRLALPAAETDPTFRGRNPRGDLRCVEPGPVPQPRRRERSAHAEPLWSPGGGNGWQESPLLQASKCAKSSLEHGCTWLRAVGRGRIVSSRREHRHSRSHGQAQAGSRRPPAHAYGRVCRRHRAGSARRPL